MSDNNEIKMSDSEEYSTDTFENSFSSDEKDAVSELDPRLLYIYDTNKNVKSHDIETWGESFVDEETWEDSVMDEGTLVESFAGEETTEDSVESSKDIKYVNVFAELKDPNVEVPGLDVVTIRGNLVTGSIEVNQILSVQSDPNIITIQMARPLRPELDSSLNEFGVSQDLLKKSFPNFPTSIDGNGVMVGVIDSGCDFVNKNFIKENGKTRILYLFDQRGRNNPKSPSGFSYGREFNSNDINEALKTQDPYKHLKYNPGPGRDDQGSHGTHVLDIVAGNGRETGYPGVAPNVDIIFVHVDARDAPFDDFYGDSVRLEQAVEYIIRKAKELEQPVVINISLGTHGGPHDGTSYIEKMFDDCLKKPGRAIVLAAGNCRETGCHSTGKIAPTKSKALTWRIPPNDPSFNEMEIWYEKDNLLQITIVGKIWDQNIKIGPVATNEDNQIIRKGDSGPILIDLRNRRSHLNYDNLSQIFLHHSVSGELSVILENIGADPLNFHAWIERDSRGQSKFLDSDQSEDYTLNSIANGAMTLVIGSYQTINKEISKFSSKGPTRDNKQKPEVNAPGEWINAAKSLKKTTVKKRGTSMAAPHVTGLIALLFQVGGPDLTTTQIRDALVSNAITDVATWDSVYGFGRIDGIKTLEQFI